MSLATCAGTSFMPFLSRLVLAAAFFFSGWHLCFQQIEFTPEQIRMLEGDAVAATPVALLDEDPAPASEAANASASPASIHGAAKAAVSQTASSPKESATASSATRRAAAMSIALRLREAGFDGWSRPTAWAAAVAQLLGGLSVLIGLLTRFWSLLMLIMIGTSLWLTSIRGAGMFDMSPFQWAAQGAVFEQMMFFAMSCVLAFGLLLTGPGLLAVDRVLWPRERASKGAATTELAATH